jgi:RNA polymerase sigma-70 factor (ECF subfamily)
MPPDTEELLRQVSEGRREARGPLLLRHRERLRRMIDVRMSAALQARLDPSDVVQEALAEADRRLDDYARERPVAFYPWLRAIAWERLVEQHRRHLRAGRRSVLREEALVGELSSPSCLELAERLLDRGDRPSEAMMRQERRQRVQAALALLTPQERDVLILRYLEELSAREVGAVLGLGEEAAKKRALRALQRLRDLLGGRP